MTISPEISRVFNTPLTKDELKRFQDIERQQAEVGKERYGLLPQKNVFQLRSCDVLQLSSKIDGVKIEKRPDCLHIATANPESNVVLDPGLADLVQGILDQLANPQSFSQIKSVFEKDYEAIVIKNVCEQLLGICVEIPDTIASLENALPLNGLLRLPIHSPYKLPRAYWENSISVRQALPLLYAACNSKEDFLKAIAGLHRIATVGETGENIYGGSGGASTEPGCYRRNPVLTTVTRWHMKTFEWWLRFLNVPVRLVREGVIKSLGKRAMVDIKMDGLHCVHLYEKDHLSVVKLLDEARENLNNCIRAASKGNVDIMLGHLARFLQLFTIAHPFSNINASIAMNIVNDILERYGLGTLPHLYFDYVAQRTKPSDFALFFKSAFERHKLTKSNSQTDMQEGQVNMRRLLEAASACLEVEKAAFIAAHNRA